MHHHWTFLVHFRPYLVYIKPLWVKFFLPIPLSVSTSSHPECQNTTICVVSYPANRWSFSVILTPLHWSPIFPTSREHKNIEQLCTSWLPALLTDAIKASPVRTCVQLLTPRLLKWPEHAKNCCSAFLKPAITFTRAFSSCIYICSVTSKGMHSWIGWYLKCQ